VSLLVYVRQSKLREFFPRSLNWWETSIDIKFLLDNMLTFSIQEDEVSDVVDRISDIQKAEKEARVEASNASSLVESWSSDQVNHGFGLFVDDTAAAIPSVPAKRKRAEIESSRCNESNETECSDAKNQKE